MTARPLRWLAIVLGLFAAVFIAVLAVGEPSTSRAAESPLVGRPAPAVSGTSIDGEQVSLTDFTGQWVLVNFFATWCIPCREEHDDLVRFSNRHRVTGDAVVVGVVFDDDLGAVEQFRREKGGDWPMLLDPEGAIAVEFGVAGVPESYLLAPDGTVVSKVVGGIFDSDLEELLARAKGGG